MKRFVLLLLVVTYVYNVNPTMSSATLEDKPPITSPDAREKNFTSL